MISKMRERVKNKKGFTLVELIVVLVILAILIALLVPSLTGYIDKANEKKVLAEAKLALNAVQATESDSYAETSTSDAGYVKETDYDVMTKTGDKVDSIKKLAEVTGYSVFRYSTDESGTVIKLEYQKDKHKATYENKSWKAETVAKVANN